MHSLFGAHLGFLLLGGFSLSQRFEFGSVFFRVPFLWWFEREIKQKPIHLWVFLESTVRIWECFFQGTLFVVV